MSLRAVGLPITGAPDVARRSAGLTSGPGRGRTGGGAAVLAAGFVDFEITRFDELYQRWVLGRLGSDLTGLGRSQEQLFAPGQRYAYRSVGFVGDIHISASPPWSLHRSSDLL